MVWNVSTEDYQIKKDTKLKQTVTVYDETHMLILSKTIHTSNILYYNGQTTTGTLYAVFNLHFVIFFPHKEAICKKMGQYVALI